MTFQEDIAQAVEQLKEINTRLYDSYVGAVALITESRKPMTVEEATGRITSVFIEDGKPRVYLEGLVESIPAEKIKIIDYCQRSIPVVKQIGIRFNPDTYCFDAFHGDEILGTYTSELFEDIFPMMKQRGGYINFTKDQIHINK